MKKGEKMKGFATKFSLVSVFLVLLVTFIVTPLSNASAESLSQREVFENNLEQQAISDANAKMLLDQYSQLSEDKKQEFIDLLSSPELATALQDSTTTTETGTKTYADGDIVVGTESATEDDPLTVTGDPSLRYLPGSSTKSAVASVTQTLYIFGLAVTHYWEEVGYNYTGTRTVVSMNYERHGHWNINPSTVVSDLSGDKWASGGWAYGYGNFSVSLTGTLGFYSMTHTIHIQCDPFYTKGWLD